MLIYNFSEKLLGPYSLTGRRTAFGNAREN